MYKIAIISRNKYLEEALNSSGFFKDNEITTSLNPKAKVNLFILDELPIMRTYDNSCPQIKISKQVSSDLKKPFKLGNLISIIQNKLESKEAITSLGNLIFDKKKKQVKSKNNIVVSLTMKEAQILEYLLSNLGKEKASEQILNDVWGVSKKLQTRTIETHICSLRKKLARLDAANFIQTKTKGYVLKLILK